MMAQACSRCSWRATSPLPPFGQSVSRLVVVAVVVVLASTRSARLFDHCVPAAIDSRTFLFLSLFYFPFFFPFSRSFFFPCCCCNWCSYCYPPAEEAVQLPFEMAKFLIFRARSTRARWSVVLDPFPRVLSSRLALVKSAPGKSLSVLRARGSHKTSAGHTHTHTRARGPVQFWRSSLTTIASPHTPKQLAPAAAVSHTTTTATPYT